MSTHRPDAPAPNDPPSTPDRGGNNRRGPPGTTRSEGWAGRPDGPWDNPVGAVSLIRLRWLAITCELALFVGVSWALDVAFDHLLVALVIGFEVALNLAAIVALRRGVPQGPRLLSAYLILDLIAFTLLLSLSGGPYNPFSFLYLVYIVVALVVVGPRHAAAMVALALLGYGLLFTGHEIGHGSPHGPAMMETGAEMPSSPAGADMPMGMQMPPESAGARGATARVAAAGGGHSSTEMALHLVGMWFAFLVAAVAMLVLVGRLLLELQRRTDELAAVRERSMLAQRLASLTTLAAGAAHELATPLSSIAVMSRELERSLADRPGDDELLADARTIRAEVTRCKAILDQLAVDAGQVAGDGGPTRTVADLLDEAMRGWRGAESARFETDPAATTRLTTLPMRPLRNALMALLDNAHRAEGRRGPVQVRVLLGDRSLVVEVGDDGAGMDEDTLRQATDPFFTTRSQGEGMGLGLFLAQSVATGLGGALSLRSQPGAGTTARLDLPLEPAGLVRAAQEGT